MSQGTLGYAGKATTSRDGAHGVVYVHRWPTGAQELVFPTHLAARQWAAGNELQYQPIRCAVCRTYTNMPDASGRCPVCTDA